MNLNLRPEEHEALRRVSRAGSCGLTLDEIGAGCGIRLEMVGLVQLSTGAVQRVTITKQRGGVPAPWRLRMNQISPGTELEVIPRETALTVLTDEAQFDAFFAKVKAEVDSHVPDVTTQKGRDAIKSLAFKVVKTKTALDAAGKELTEDKRKEIAAVDAARKRIRDQLDALRDEVRRPVTEWEEAEAERVADVEATLARLNAAAIVSIEDTVETVSARLIEVEAIEITDEHFQDHAPAARARQCATQTTLEAALVRLRQEAADRAELERLRKANEEREAAEKAAAEAKAKAEQEARDKAEAEARAKREAEERERLQQEAAQRAAQEAETRAREEAEAKANAEREAQERAHQEQLAKERAEREAAQAEAKRLADEKAAADAKAAADKAAADRRAADIEHRSKVMGAAKTALMGAGGIGEEAAKKIVLAIKAGEIPAVTITF